MKSVNSLALEIENFLEGTPLDSKCVNRNDDGLLFCLQIGIDSKKQIELLRKAASLLMIAKEQLFALTDDIKEYKNEILNLNGGE